MIKSERIDALVPALVAFQAEIGTVQRKSLNPFFKSHYADLAECWETVRIPLTNHKLAIVQSTDLDEEGGVIVETILLHESGEFIAGKLRMKPEKDGPQALGSCITYARRYGLMAITGLAPVDDDGNAATVVPIALTKWDGKDWRLCPNHLNKDNPTQSLASVSKKGVDWLLHGWEPTNSDADRQLHRAVRMMADEMAAEQNNLDNMGDEQ